jgi:hypothetical protein
MELVQALRTSRAAKSARGAERPELWWFDVVRRHNLLRKALFYRD